MRCNLRLLAVGVVGVVAFAALGKADTATFDDLELGVNSYWNGSDMSGTHEVQPDPYDPTGLSTIDVYQRSFTSNGASFPNKYNATYYSWSGWAYSNRTDNATGGFDPNTWARNGEYSAIPGSGVNSANYGVAFTEVSGASKLSLANAVEVQGAYFTNTTYAYFDMLNGSGFSKNFGGPTGTDEDYFLLTITGKDASGNVTGTVPFYLADFTSPNSANDYIVNDWRWLDLTGLGNKVKALEFLLSSTDNDPLWGMNTPAYFAMDNLTFHTVPEPSTLVLIMAGGLAAIAWRRRRRKS